MPEQASNQRRDSADRGQTAPKHEHKHVSFDNIPSEEHSQRPRGSIDLGNRHGHDHHIRPQSEHHTKSSSDPNLKPQNDRHIRSSSAHHLKSPSDHKISSDHNISSDNKHLTNSSVLSDVSFDGLPAGQKHDSSAAKTGKQRKSQAPLQSVSAAPMLSDDEFNKKIEMIKKGIELKDEIPYELARARFQHAIKIVLILQKWINSLTEKEEDEGKAGKAPAAKTFTDIASEAFQSDQFREAGLSFDLSYFKAKKEGNQDVNISNEVKHVLSIPSVARTPDQLQTALYGLQHLKSFAEYPLHMQEKLCKVAWFQQVPPKRVIIRQGHFAENFYFILSGQAVVRILEKNPQSGETQLRTATIMRKGTSFGELALLHHSLRTATVVSQDSVQLLTIGRDDFFDIFMSGSGPGQIPEHIQFVAGLDFMGNFPIDKLLENPEYCLFHFFKRGVVIVKDSNVSDWIYIVKSGSCQVMKELKGVTPRVGRCKSATPREEPGPKLPRLGVGDTYTKVNTGLRKPKIHSLSAPHPLRREQTFNGEDLTKSHFDSSENDPVDQVHNENAQHTSRSQPEIYDDSNKGREINPVMLTTINHNGEAKPGFSKSRYRHMSLTTKKAHFLNEEDIKNDINKKQTKPGSAKSSSTRSAPTSARRRVRTPVKKEETDDYYDEEEFSLKGPVFVKVELLKPKDVFGLNTVDFDYEPTSNSTSVSLVSNGAECIMLSKKFFTENANELVKCNVRYLVRSYPPEEALQDNLQNKVDWNVYKKRLIRQTIHNMHKVSVR